MKIRNKTVFVYDIEVFPNVFTCTIKNTETNTYNQLEISDRKNDLQAIVDMFWTVRDPNINKFQIDLGTDCIFCGYNNLHYDNPIINYIIDYYEIMCNLPVWKITQSIFNLSNTIISSTGNNFNKWTKWKYAVYFETIDLLAMLFSNKLRVGLKEMEVTMQVENVDEYQGDFQAFLPNSKIDDVLLYNKHDVDATHELLNRCKKDIDLRISIEDEYNIKALSKDGVNLGMEILKQRYLAETGLKWNDIKDLQSPCDHLCLKDIIFDFIEFETPVLQNLLKDLKSQCMNPNDNSFERTFVLGENKYTYGMGGVHTVNKPSSYASNEDMMLVDVDVMSMYPSIILEHRVFPPHLGEEFLKVYGKIKEDRIKAKHDGNKTVDSTLKLSLNGLSGNLQSPYSWVYSPKTVLQIRLNGQLMLLMLAEQFEKAGISVVQANTDGLFIYYDRKKHSLMEQLCREWEKRTKLILEADYFESFYQFAINDYIGVKQGYSETKNPDLIKTKGMFLTKVALGKGMNATIIPEAIIKNLIDNTPVEKTITECKDIHKFITYQKVSKDYCVEYNGELIQRINRFYYSKIAPWLYKCKVDKETGKRSRYIKLNTKTGVRICNIIDKDFEFPNDINYQYYIAEAQKIVDQFKCQQLTLF